jgi:hypothetical protein
MNKLIIGILMIALIAGLAHLGNAQGIDTNALGLPGAITADPVQSGYIGSQAATIGTASAVLVGSLSAGTKVIEIFTTADLNFGGVGLNTGTGEAYIPANTIKELRVATLNPAIYLRGRAATATVKILHRK